MAFSMVTTLCLSGAAIRKAGISLSGATMLLADEFINQAEGLVIADSKYDWITNYSSLLSGTKFFLEDVVSDLAAINLVKYDLDAFSERIIGEDVLNVLWASANKKREILQSADKVKFLTNP